MKLKETFMTMVMDDENLLMEVGGRNFTGMVRNNETAAFIVECLKEETTPEKIVDAMCKEYRAPKEVIAAGVARVIDTLRSINALGE